MRVSLLSAMLVLTACTGAVQEQSSRSWTTRHAQACPAPSDPAAMAALPLARPRDPSPSQMEMAHHAVKIVPPLYPLCAKQMNIGGIVDFAFTLEPDGSVGDFKVIQELPTGFGFAAAGAAVFGQWKFPPHLVDGKAVATPATYRFTWKLS
jgi:protein TonB